MPLHCFRLETSKLQPDLTPLTQNQKSAAKRRWKAAVDRYGSDRLGAQQVEFAATDDSYMAIARLTIEMDLNQVANWVENQIEAANIFEWWELWYHKCWNAEKRPCEKWIKLREGTGTV